MKISPLHAALIVLSGCDGCNDDDAVETDFRSADVRLVRASMALRGIRPSIEEMENILQDPGLLEGMIDEWLDDPEFGTMIRDMHAEQLKLRSDLHEVPPPIGTLADLELYDIFHAVNEGPLVLIEEIVMEGRPYSEIVTSDSLRVNAVGARVWGADYDPSGAEWQPFVPTDGRPAWGILSDGALWIRHVSNGGNYQRARANMVADALLCEDFLVRDIPIDDDLDLSDDAAVSNALYENPSCVSCHQSLDPLGGFLWGFLTTFDAGVIAQTNSEDCTPLSEMNISSDPGNAFRQASSGALCYPLEPWIGAVSFDYEGSEYAVTDVWSLLNLRAPGYYGLGDEQTELGSYIAADPRFSACTVKRFYGYLSQSDSDTVPLDVQGELLAVFEDSNMDARELAKAVVLSKAFDELDLQTTRPEQYARLIEDLTGFRWELDLNALSEECEDGGCYGTAHLGLTDTFGFRSMSGGMDGFRVTAPTHTDTPTRQLVLARHAAEAAGYVVEQDFSGTPRLLTAVSSSTTDEGTIRSQLAQLHLRILSEEVASDSAEVDDTYALFSAALSQHGDPETAWKVVLTAMFQAPSLLFY